MEASPQDDFFIDVESAAEFHAVAYRKFVFLRGVIDPSPMELLDPSAFALKRPRLSFSGKHHAFTAELLVQGVANRVNELCIMLIGLKTWQSILQDYDSRARRYLEFEFVSPILRLAIAEIAGIKNQVAFSVAKLAIQIDSDNCARPIPSDREISSNTWEIWARDWSRFSEFKAALREVNARDFLAATRDFRNRRAHAIAPSFSGIVPAHVVSREAVGLKIEFCFEEKLEIGSHLLYALNRQHVIIVKLVQIMKEFLHERFDREAFPETTEY